MPRSNIPSDPQHPLQSCGDLTVEGLYHGLFTGAIYGLIMSRQIRKNNNNNNNNNIIIMNPTLNNTLNNPPHSYYTRVIKPTVSMSLLSSLMFGSVLGIYNYTSCNMKLYRQKYDFINSMTGGAVAGFTISLPNLVLNKGYTVKNNWRVLVLNTTAVATIGCFLHVFSNLWNPTLVQSQAEKPHFPSLFASQSPFKRIETQPYNHSNNNQRFA